MIKLGIEFKVKDMLAYVVVDNLADIERRLKMGMKIVRIIYIDK